MTTKRLFDAATKMRSNLSDMIHGATHEQRVKAARKLYAIDATPEGHRQSKMYTGNVNLCESGEGVRFWLDENLDSMLYYGASTILRQRGPANDTEARIEMHALQQCLDALVGAGAVATPHQAVQSGFRECGGSVSYI